MHLAVLVAVLAVPSLRAQSLEEYDRVGVSDVQGRPGFHHAGCTGRVVGPRRKPVAGARVALVATRTAWGTFPIARVRAGEDGRFTLRDLSFPGQAVLWAGWPARARRVELVDGAVTDVGTLRLEEVQDEPEPRRIRGRIRTPDGGGLAGVVVVALGAEDEWDPTAFARTDAAGSFAIDARLGACTSLVVFPLGRRISVEHEAGLEAAVWSTGAFGRSSVHADLTQPVDVRLEGLKKVELAASGVEEVRFEWDDAVSWAPLATSAVWIWASDYGGSLRVRARSPGRLPRAARISLPGRKSKKPAPSRQVFDFGTGVERRLGVAAGDAAAAGAWIDLVEDGVELGRYRVGREGELGLRAPAEARVVAWVYAEGCAPRRVLWDGPARVALARRDARVVFGALDGVARIRVKRAGSPYASAFLDTGGRDEVTTRLAPGRYDLTFLDASWKVRRASRIRVAAGKELRVPKTDDRPVVRLTLPDPPAGAGPWSVGGSRHAAGTFVTGWAAMSGGRGAAVQFEPPVEVEKLDDHSYRLEFVAPGDFVVTVAAEKLAHSFYREVSLAPRARVRLVLPGLAARLEGSRRSYHPLSGQHGVAGPRFVLVADVETRGRGGFDVVVPLPGGAGEMFGMGEAKKTFRLASLPAGRYHAYAHLTGRDEKGPKYTFNRPVYGWGGVPVVLEAGRTARLADFADLARRSLTVVVEPAGGGAPERARLRIRDRMYELWRQVEEGGSTLRFATDAIPPPPSVEVEGGRARFEAVHGDRLELILELARGRWVRMTRVLTEKPLVLRLPRGR